MSSLNLPLEQLLPHRRKMKFVTELVSIDENGSGRVRADLIKDMHYMKNGRLSPTWTFEIMAQAVAAVFAGIRHVKNEAPNLGFLISIEEYWSEADNLPGDGESIFLDVALIYDLFPIGQYEIKASWNDRVFSYGRMKFLIDAQKVVS